MSLSLLPSTTSLFPSLLDSWRPSSGLQRALVVSCCDRFLVLLSYMQSLSCNTLPIVYTTFHLCISIPISISTDVSISSRTSASSQSLHFTSLFLHLVTSKHDENISYDILHRTKPSESGWHRRVSGIGAVHFSLCLSDSGPVPGERHWI